MPPKPRWPFDAEGFHEALTRGVLLSKATVRSLRFTAPVLFILGVLETSTASRRWDHGVLVTSLCLCVCAAGLFVEDQVQRDYHRDRTVLAHVAAHPGASTRQVARAIGVGERAVVRSLRRLTDEGFLVLESDGATSALRSYRLAS
ncbi:winged helix-turn-helix domain-containing protein [Streptomyces sp. NPDC057654]|uniref:winged helix-turn-helix domain-containing protein n=1 Tax=Streptomyces sp. NPDC057654 TaxID=3346196 RepID=UPI00367534FF